MASERELRDEIRENRTYIMQLIESVARLEERSRITYMMWGALGGAGTSLLVVVLTFLLAGG